MACDSPSDQLAGEYEEYRQAEVAPKVPPHACVMIGERQRVD